MFTNGLSETCDYCTVTTVTLMFHFNLVINKFILEFDSQQQMPTHTLGEDADYQSKLPI